MNNIQIKDSYKIWNAERMKDLIDQVCYEQYNSYFPQTILNRDYDSMCIEWWLHNIGYYITKPFCNIKFFKNINLRCKDVDLNERYY